MSDVASTGPAPPPSPCRFRARPGAVAVVVVAAGVVLWLLIRGGDDDTTNPKPVAAPRPATPVLTSGRGLRKVAAVTAFPIYWAGRVPGRKLELSQTSSGNVYVRYLPSDAPLGDTRPSYLTVATYPLAGAHRATRAAARQPGAVTRRLRPDGLAVAPGRQATSAYFSYPNGRVQVEVFSPEPGHALRLVADGRVRSVRP